MKNLMKNLVSIAALALLTTQAQAASFEPLGPSRTIGDVYDDLMTVDEMNQYIDGQGMSNASEYTYLGQVYLTRHTLNNPHEISDIIDVSSLDYFLNNIYDIRYIVMIKGDVEKYSHTHIYDRVNGPYIDVYHFGGGGSFSDGSTGVDGRPINISIKGNTTQVPEPSIIYLMLACLLPVGLRRLKSCI